MKRIFMPLPELAERYEHIHPSLKIIDSYKENNKTIIKIYCSKCNQTFEKNRKHLVCNPDKGCPICCNRKIVKGVNDVSTTDKWMIKYFANEEDIYTHSSGSTDNVIMKCPTCGKPRRMSIANLRNRKGFNCNYCGDGVSYPNKFSRSLLLQLGVDKLIPEYSPQWISPKRFDNYFEYKGEQYILEMDGGFHYMDNTYNGENVEVTIDNDFRKDLVAKFHGIEVIRIDCRSLDKNKIKEEIEKSRLSNIFDLSNVDWDKCEIDAQKSLTKETWNLFNSGKRIYEISEEIGVTRATVRKYLKKGASIGVVDYQCENGRRVLDKNIDIYTIYGDYITSCATYYQCIDVFKEHNPHEKYSYITTKKHCIDETPYKGFIMKRRAV